MLQVGAELNGRAARAGAGGPVCVVAIGMELADLVCRRTPEEPDMSLRLVGEVRDDVPT